MNLIKYLKDLDFYEKRKIIDINHFKDDINTINFGLLSLNPNAINILKNNMDKINWNNLSLNPNAISILEKNLDKVNWKNLSFNPNAILILGNNIDKINWFTLSVNPNAIPLLKSNMNKIDWNNLSLNPNAIPLLEKNVDKINFSNISLNKNLGKFSDFSIFIDNKINRSSGIETCCTCLIYNYEYIDNIQLKKMIESMKNICNFDKKMYKNGWFYNPSKYYCDINQCCHNFQNFLNDITGYNNNPTILYSIGDGSHRVYTQPSYQGIHSLFKNKNPLIIKFLEFYLNHKLDKIFENSDLKKQYYIIDTIINWFFLKTPLNINLFSQIKPKFYIHRIKCICDCNNPNAMSIIEKYIDKLDIECWKILSKNPSAISILEKNLDKLDDDCWKELSKNTNAISILQQNMHKINWNYLSLNINAMDILEKKIGSEKLIQKESIHFLLKDNFDNIGIDLHSSINIMNKKFDKINYDLERIDKLDLDLYSTYNNVISILDNEKKRIDKLDLNILNMDATHKDKLELILSNNLNLKEKIDTFNLDYYHKYNNIISILDNEKKRIDNLDLNILKMDATNKDKLEIILSNNLNLEEKIDTFNLNYYHKYNNIISILDNEKERIDNLDLNILKMDATNKDKIEIILSNNLDLEEKIDKLDLEYYDKYNNIISILEQEKERNIIYDLCIFLVFCIFICIVI